LNLEFDFAIVLKFGSWASELPDDVDFIDYWFNLFLSQTKALIDSNPMHKINAFHWTRWQEDFEQFVDGYKPTHGASFSADQREWFACYMQYVVYGLQLTAKQIAEHYGKDVFLDVMRGFSRYHTFGVDLFVETFAGKFGLPSGRTVHALYM